jgi:5'-nucleotidase
MKMKSLLYVLVLILAMSLLVVPAGAKSPATVNVQILAVNDFHGNLEPPAGSSGRSVPLLQAGPSTWRRT